RADARVRGTVGEVRGGYAARRAAVAVPLGHRAGPGVPGPPAAPVAQRDDHDRVARVRARALVAAPAPQPDGTAHQGRPAVPQGRGRHERSLSPEVVAGRRRRPRVGKASRAPEPATSDVTLGVVCYTPLSAADIAWSPAAR